MQGTMSSSLVANLLLICDKHRDERLRFEIFLRHVLYIFTCDLSNKIGVSVRIVQPQLKIFNLGQEIRDLAVGIEAQRKAPGQISFASESSSSVTRSSRMRRISALAIRMASSAVSFFVCMTSSKVPWPFSALK